MTKSRAGTVIGSYMVNHRHEEFLKFLRTRRLLPHTGRGSIGETPTAVQ
ncbi:MAG: hypothetical protein ACXVGN_01025 [Mycobacteriaceae bacterium]